MEINNIYDYLNIKNKFRDMSDEEFNIFSSVFSKKLYEYTFDKLLENYNNSLLDSKKDGKIKAFDCL